MLEAVAQGRPAPSEQTDSKRCDLLLAACLEEAVADLRRRHGSNPSRWSWGQQHQVRYQHPIAKSFPPLRAILDRGPFAGSGDSDTVRVMGRDRSGGTTSAICRAVYDLADWNNSVISHAPGQSGHAASPHYADMISGYLAGSPQPIVFGPQSFERGLGRRRVLRLLVEPDNQGA